MHDPKPKPQECDYRSDADRSDAEVGNRTAGAVLLYDFDG